MRANEGGSLVKSIDEGMDDGITLLSVFVVTASNSKVFLHQAKELKMMRSMEYVCNHPCRRSGGSRLIPTLRFNIDERATWCLYDNTTGTCMHSSPTYYVW